MLKTKECKHGTFTFLANDKWIGGGLEQEGTYSEEEVQLLLSVIDSNSVVIEVGANIGAITVPLAKKAGMLDAFEPQPYLAGLLRKNISDNRLDDSVTVVTSGVAAAIGHMDIEPIDYGAADINSGAVRLVAQDAGSSWSAVTTLDIYCRDFERLDLIKIDVEGMEGAVLEGARDTIARLKPMLYVENDRAENSVALIRQIMEMGYRLWWHFPALHNPDPTGPQTFASTNMLCVPHGQLQPSGLQEIVNPDASAKLDHEKLRLLQPQPQASPRRRGKTWACIVRLGGVGDNLIAGAVLPGLKQKFDCVEVIASEPQHVVFENNPYVDKLTVLEQGKPEWGTGLSWQAYWHERAKEYDGFYHLSHTVEVLRALTPIQTAYQWSAKYRRKTCGQSYIETAADICDVPYETLRPDFYPDELEVANAQEVKRKLGGRYVAWIIAGTRPDKKWPPAALVVARVIKELKVPVVLFGMPSQPDHDDAGQIMEWVATANGSTAGLHIALSRDQIAPHWPVRRVLTQVQQADVVVGPDTGPMWAVSMHDVPKVMLLSHASAANISKRWRNTVTLHAKAADVPCWPCHQLHDTRGSCQAEQQKAGMKPNAEAKGAACIMSISVDDVVAQVVAALNQQHGARIPTDFAAMQSLAAE